MDQKAKATTVFFNFVESKTIQANISKAKLGQIVDTDNFLPLVSTEIIGIDNSDLMTPTVEGATAQQIYGGLYTSTKLNTLNYRLYSPMHKKLNLQLNNIKTLFNKDLF